MKAWSVGRRLAAEDRKRKSSAKPIAGQSNGALKIIVMARTLKHISEKVETLENARRAFRLYSKHKRGREKVRRYEKHLESHLKTLVNELRSGEWTTPEYSTCEIQEHKKRILSKLPVRAHVAQWAYLYYIEKPLCDTYIRQSCSCVKGRGTHDFIKMLYHRLYTDTNSTLYFVQLDAHHYFQNIEKQLMKDKVAKKIRDGKALDFIYEFIHSHLQGLPLGQKISQILANFFLFDFDHSAKECFGIDRDLDRMAYWRRRYVEDKIATFHTPDETAEVNRGIDYLNRKFDRLVSEWKDSYFRFADNMVLLSEDKTFLHILAEIAIYRLASKYHIDINKCWNVRPVWSGGIDICGYVLFQDHIMERKRNKKALCREVAQCRHKGMSEEMTRLKCASRIGFASHADSTHLLSKLGFDMERLRNKTKRKKAFLPWPDMTPAQKKPFSELICHDEKLSKRFEVVLTDYIITDSRIHFDTVTERVTDRNGKVTSTETQVPKKCICLRYSIDGNEYYSFSGSHTLMEILDEEYGKESLPALVTILEGRNKVGKKFFTII